MATLKEKIAAARAAGYSDQEIQQKLSQTSEYKQATEAGYSPDQVWEHLGFDVAGAGAGATPPAAPPAQLFSGSDEGSRLGRATALTGSGVVKGLANVLGLPGDAEALINAGATKLGLPGAGEGHFLPTSSDMVGLTNSLGLTNRPDLVPQNPVEQFGSAAAEGLGTGLPFAPGGALLATSSGIGGGLGAETAQTAFPDSPWAPVIGGLIGGFGAGAGVSMIEKALARGDLKAAQSAFDEATAQRAEMGLTHRANLAEAAAGREAAIGNAKASADAHLSSNIAPADATIEATASALHPAATLQEAGAVAQQAAKHWVASEMPKRLGEAWAPVNTLIPKDSPVTLGAFGSALDSITSSAGALEPLAEKLKPSAPKALKAALDKLTELNDLGGAAPISWGDVQKLRSTLGDALSNPKVVADVGEQNLRRLYATLTADMRQTARGVGPQALDAFNSANEQSSQIYKLAEGPISKILNNDPNPEAVAKALTTGGKIGASDLAALRTEIPEAANALASTVIRTGGWTKLAPEAKAALVPDLAQRSALDTAHIAKLTAKDAADQMRKQGIEGARGAYDSLSTGQGAEKLAADAAYLRAKQDLAKAKQAHSPLTQAARYAGHGGFSLLGLGSGYEIGDVLTSAFALPQVAQPTLALAGAAVPAIIGGVRQIARNPRLLVAPSIGTMAGNALALRQGQ